MNLGGTVLKIGIVADVFKDPNFKILKETAKILEELGVEVVYPDTRAQHRVNRSSEVQDSWNACDLAISIGGDGTFLYTCSEIYGLDIPLIGVNRGSFGFLTEIDANHLSTALLKLVKGQYIIEQRMMLEVKVFDATDNVLYTSYGLNDAVLYRGDISRIIPCVLKINGSYIQTVSSDGIIIAGPSGSTGYAMSCGGPIVDPGLNLMQITPISPHSLQARTYVVSPGETIEVSIKEDYLYEPMLSVDGKEGIKINNSNRIEVKKAPKYMLLASISQDGFFKNLPEKLNARGIRDESK